MESHYSVAPWACAVLAMFPGVCPADARVGYRAGTGRADITPQGPIRMAGYANRVKPSEGVDQPLYARALALQYGQDPPFVLLTADMLGFPREVSEDIAGRLREQFKLPRANLLLVASHTHSGPVVGRHAWVKRLYDLQGQEAEAVERYTGLLTERATAAAAQALARMQPVKLSFGRGKVGFAANRRVVRPGGVRFGVDREGVVDQEVPVLRVDTSEGKLWAVVFGYACHCTTLTGDHYRIGGDWAGYAADFLERSHPGATALFLTGCGGDANPEPRGNLDLARRHGEAMATAVDGVLAAARTPVEGKLTAVLERVHLPLVKVPTREEFQERSQSPDVSVRRHARWHLELLERGAQLPTGYPCPVQVWQLGHGLTLVALGGEVVADYALRLKRELTGRAVWTAGYANDVFAYVPSARVLNEGGYEADDNLIYYGLPGRFRNDIEGILIKKVHELAKNVR